MEFVGYVTDDEWLEACREQNYTPDEYDPDIVFAKQIHNDESSIKCNLYNHYNRYVNDRSIPEYDMCASLKEYASANFFPRLELNVKSKINSIIFKIFYNFFRLRVTIFDQSNVKFYRDGIYWSEGAVKT